MKIKNAPAKVKAAGDADGLEEGQFEAIVSVFGNEDSVGDVVLPGAFTDDLAEWAAKGDPIPVIWSHDWRDPFSHLGHVVKAEERDEGLWVRGQLDLDNDKAAQVYRLLKGRRVTQFSFAYDVLEGGWGERDGREVYELKKLKVHEVGPCLLGANQETELLAVKARDLAARLKAGDTIDLEQLTGAYDALGAVIEATKTPAPDGAGDTKREAGQPDPDAANDPAASGTSAEQKSKVSPAQVAAWTTIKEIAS